ncbi:hypothetical protein [Pseudoalteromonas sp. '520P1 No. 423']|nr:hypothetical protein [Pseudoalteromonas sp. '520P1 No. 423']
MQILKISQRLDFGISIFNDSITRVFDPDLLQAIIKSSGVYVAGSLVKLKTGKVGYVKEFKLDTASSPIVHCFFNARFNHHIEASDIDLYAEFIEDAIEATINKSDNKLALEQYI